jgi:outer membrane protein assembly factor BamB
MMFRVVALLTVCAIALAGCEQPQPIIPGKREAVDTLIQDAPVRSETVNKSVAFRAPGMSTNANWTQGHGTARSRTTHPTLGAKPQLVWSVPIGVGDGQRTRITADPVVADGHIFTVDAEARLSAHATSGAALWSIDLTPQGEGKGEATGAGIAHGNGTLFMTTAYGMLYAINPTTGAIRWSQTLRGAGNTRPTYYDGLVYVISSDRTAWAIEADNGRVRWQIDGVDDVNNRIGSTAPAVSDKFALFGFGSGEVQAVFRKGGLVYWNSSLKGARAGRAEGAVVDLGASPVIAGSRVYAAGASGRMVAMSLGNGERIWTNNQGVRGQLWPAGNAIFALNDMNQLIRVDASNGETLWAVDLPNFRKINPRRSAEIVAHYGPVLAGGRILVASNDGLLRQFDPTNGALIAQTAVPGGATTHPVVAGGVLYLVSGDGQLHAFR